MPGRFYLTIDTAAVSPTAGEKSTAMPVGTLVTPGGGAETNALSPFVGSAAANISWTTLAQTADQDTYVSRFSTAALGAQSIAANTWTFAYSASESNTSANIFISPSLYVWRPSGSSVVGFIYDSHTALGTEWATSGEGRVTTFSGGSVTVQDSDILVLEVWAHATQAMTTAYSGNFLYGSTVIPVEGVALLASAASYVETPQDIGFLAPPPFPPYLPHTLPLVRM